MTYACGNGDIQRGARQRCRDEALRNFSQRCTAQNLRGGRGDQQRLPLSSSRMQAILWAHPPGNVPPAPGAVVPLVWREDRGLVKEEGGATGA